MLGNYGNKIQWILDSGGYHHMTALSHILKGDINIDKPFHVVTPIGDTTLVEEMRDMELSTNIILHNILLVSYFNCNFISIHMFTRDLNYIINHDQNSSIIQD